jgi:hypothetical protein
MMKHKSAKPVEQPASKQTLAKPILLDRVLLDDHGKQIPLWMALTEDRRILIVGGDGVSVAPLDLINLVKVKGMGSKLRLYTASGPTYIQLLPPFRDPGMGPKNMYGGGAVGNLYLEGKYERLSNVMLWVNYFKEYNIPVSYWKTSVAIPLMIIGSLLGIIALAGIVMMATLFVGVFQAFYN